MLVLLLLRLLLLLLLQKTFQCQHTPQPMTLKS